MLKHDYDTGVNKN